MSTDSNPSDREGMFYDPNGDPISIDSSSATPLRESSPAVVPESPLPQHPDIAPLPSSLSRPSSAPTASSGTCPLCPSTSDLRTNLIPPIDELPSSSSAQPSVPLPLLRNWRTHRSVDPDRPFDPLDLDVLTAYRPIVPQLALRQTADLLAPLEEGVTLGCSENHSDIMTYFGNLFGIHTESVRLGLRFPFHPFICELLNYYEVPVGKLLP